MGNAESSSTPVYLNPGSNGRSKPGAGISNVNGDIKFLPQASDDVSPLIKREKKRGASVDIESPLTAPMEITTQNKDFLPLLEKQPKSLLSVTTRKNIPGILEHKEHEIGAPKVDKSYYVYSNVASRKGKRTCRGVINHFFTCDLTDRRKAIGLVTLFLIILVGLVVISSKRSTASNQITDFSDVNSSMDLKLGSIHHWCLSGGDSDCTCGNPLDPDSDPDHGNLEKWSTVHGSNKIAIEEYVSAVSSQDLVFVGGSTVEGWNGEVSMLLLFVWYGFV